MDYIEVSKRIPIRGAYDVLVSGGGPSGIMAALAAARNGARTGLIDRNTFLGGMATAGLVTPISAFSYNGRQIIGGMPWEFVERLVEVGGAVIEKPYNIVLFDPEKYKLIAQRMLLEAGVEMTLGSSLIGCRMAGSIIRGAIVENKSGAQAMPARVLIDATGDADLSHMARVPMLDSDIRQPATLCFTLGGVDTSLVQSMNRARQGNRDQDEEIRAILLKLKEQDADAVPDFGGPWICDMIAEGRVQVNATRMAVNAHSARDKTRASCQLREDAYRITELLKKHVAAFRNCYLEQTGSLLGIRDSRRIVGVYTVKNEEYRHSMRYPDAIARSCHPIDIHHAVSATQEFEFLQDAAFIPYRAMVAPEYDNLIVAGRAISAERSAFSSLRVQATAMAIGQAAGTAAAMCAKGDQSVLLLDTNALCEKLVSQGALIDV